MSLHRLYVSREVAELPGETIVFRVPKGYHCLIQAVTVEYAFIRMLVEVGDGGKGLEYITVGKSKPTGFYEHTGEQDPTKFS